MNFKVIVLLILLSSCGVKNNPVPAQKNIPSFIENYPDVKLNQVDNEYNQP